MYEQFFYLLLLLLLADHPSCFLRPRSNVRLNYFPTPQNESSITVNEQIIFVVSFKDTFDALDC